MEAKLSEDYKLEHLESVFMAHGVTQVHLDSWFGNYDVDIDTQQKAFDAIKLAYKDENPIIMLGKFGTGKTHLAMAIVKNYLRVQKDAKYYTFAGLFRDYRKTFSSDERNESQFFEMLTDVSMLVIDEINIRSDSEAENRFLQEVMDVRYSSNLPTVMIGNLSFDEFRGVVGDRIVDRLKEQKAEVIMFNWESMRGK